MCSVRKRIEKKLSLKLGSRILVILIKFFTSHLSLHLDLKNSVPKNPILKININHCSTVYFSSVAKHRHVCFSTNNIARGMVRGLQVRFQFT
jgi:hypothetical protein